MESDEVQTTEHPQNNIALSETLLLTAAMIAAAHWVSHGIRLLDGRVEWLWLCGPTALCLLLTQPRQRWWSIILIASLCTVTLSSLMETDGWSLALFVNPGRYLLVMLAAHLLVANRAGMFLLQDVHGMLLFVGVVVVLSALGTAWEQWATAQFSLSARSRQTANQWLAQCVAYLFAVPAWLASISRASSPVLFTARVRIAWHLLAVVPIVIACVVSMAWPHLFLHASMLAIVSLFLSTMWLGTGSGFTLALLFAIVCGPIADIARLQFSAILGGQFVMLMVAMAMLCMTMMLGQYAKQQEALSGISTRLGELTSRMLFVQEEERARIARDLHDDINQSIASISIQISALKKELDQSARSHLEGIQTDLLIVSADIRRLSHDLHPSILRYTSLAASLLALCKSSSADRKLHVECDLHEDMALNNEQKLNLFRIAQEAIHNVEAHAHASRARVSLMRERNEAVLRVDDNGIGMPRDLPQRSGCGLGMISMEERARSIGGRFSVIRLDCGSRLEVRVPLDPSCWSHESATAAEIMLSRDR